MSQLHIQTNVEVKSVGISITYFTDPLCCWSWVFEPDWQKIQHEYQDIISCTYRMGGLLPSWNNFNDPINSVTRPIQMGPIWMQASHMSGRPMQHNIWVTDPPASSYPACIAVKCAGLQGKHYEEKYLQMLWEAVMLKGINIAKDEVLLSLSQELSYQSENFSPAIFKQSLYNKEGLAAFKEDMQLVKQYNINRFPTFIVRKSNGTSLLIKGIQPYRVWKEILEGNEFSSQLKNAQNL